MTTKPPPIFIVQQENDTPGHRQAILGSSRHRPRLSGLASSSSSCRLPTHAASLAAHAQVALVKLLFLPTSPHPAPQVLPLSF